MVVHVMLTAMLLAGAPGDSEGTGKADRSIVRVPWVEIRDEVMASFCMKSYELPDGTVVWAPLAGYRNECGSAAPGAPAAEAADRAVLEIRPVLTGLKPDGLDAIAGEDLSEEEMTRRVRAIYLASEEFMNLLLPHLDVALAEADLACDGCPIPTTTTPRRVHWSELAPYVAAHAWPDAVVTTPASERGPGEKQGYGMHFCAGLNGISEMESPDPAMTRAGFVAMFHSVEAKRIASDRFGALLQGEEFSALTSDDARTEFLRARLSRELIADPELRRAACPTLSRFAEDLNLIVEECDATE